jgi:hypothetical protein
VRSNLGLWTPADAQFPFYASLLKRLSGNDYLAVECVLERLANLPFDEQHDLLEVYTNQIAKKLSIESPPKDQRQLFLEDFFLPNCAAKPKFWLTSAHTLFASDR